LYNQIFLVTSPRATTQEKNAITQFTSNEIAPSMLLSRDITDQRKAKSASSSHQHAISSSSTFNFGFDNLFVALGEFGGFDHS